MYAWIWRHLPGPTAVRVLSAALLVALVVLLLFGVIFPWAEPRLPWNSVEIETPTP